MTKKTQKGGQPWWRKRRVQRRLAAVVSLALAIGIIAWLVGRGGADSGQKQYFVEPASTFTLPTVAGDEFSLSEHLGQHVVLLYFNEGTG